MEIVGQGISAAVGMVLYWQEYDGIHHMFCCIFADIKVCVVYLTTKRYVTKILKSIESENLLCLSQCHCLPALN